MDEFFLLAASLTEEARREFINDWMKQHSSEDILTEALSVLERGEKRFWPGALDIINAIGYPRNISAISAVISLMSDFNSISVEEPIRVLSAMDHGVVIPHFIEVMLDTSHDMNVWGELVEGICISLGTKSGSVFAEACLPVLAGLLFSERTSEVLDVSFILDVFEQVGSTYASLVLPGVIHILLTTRSTSILEQVHHLLSTFDEVQLKPYTLILKHFTT